MIGLLISTTLLSKSDPMSAEVQRLLPPDAQVLFPLGPGSLTPSGLSDAMKTGLASESSSLSGSRLQVQVLRKGANQYEVQVLSGPSLLPVKKGQVLLMAFDMRSPEGGRESGEGTWYAGVQRSAPPWDGVMSSDGPASKDWRRFYISGVADKDYDKGALQATFHIAQQPQTIEIGGFACFLMAEGTDRSKLPVTKVTYRGQEPNAPWRKRAAEMIDKHRKAPLTIKVTRGGKPVSGAIVEVRQTKSSYPWGTFLDLDPTESTPASARYRDLVPKLFNRVTVPIYWADWGWENETTRKGYFNRMAWARENKLPMKAHTLVWPSMQWSPSRLRPLLEHPDQLRKTIMDEAQARFDQLKDQPFVNMDVLNELKTEQEFGKIAGFSFYSDLFKAARRSFPKADLVYNDYGIVSGGGNNVGAQQEVKRWIRRLRADGAPLTKLGFQGHFGEALTPPERVWEILDEFHGEFKLPIEVTEFDVDTRDEAAQAAYTRDFALAWFAHPATSGFTMWGFWEGAHWKPNGAMYRKDWQPKPNLAAWTELTQETLRTRAKLKTDAKGEVNLRAFHGDYELYAALGQARGAKKVQHGPVGTTLIIDLAHVK